MCFVFILCLFTVKMSIDKAWMFIKDRGSQEWQNGMKAFIDMAFAEVSKGKYNSMSML